jgi:hypothetical protein
VLTPDSLLPLLCREVVVADLLLVFVVVLCPGVPVEVDCLLPLVVVCRVPVACLVPEVLDPEVVVSLLREVLVDCLSVLVPEVRLPELLTLVEGPPPAERVL